MRARCAFVSALLLLTLPAGAQSLGEGHYCGSTPVPAQLRGHNEPLPADAARCANCHEPGRFGLRFAPVLNAESLTQPKARRGGPPSAYGQPEFCHLLRTGIDPAQVLVRKAMPQYTLSDAECAGLWAYLVNRADTPAPCAAP